MNVLANLLDWESVEQRLVESLKSHLLAPALQTLVAGECVILVRNWYGQLMLLLPCTRSELERSSCLPLVEDLRSQAGSLALPAWVMCRDELFGAEAYWSDPALLPLLHAPVQLMLLERQDKDRDWLLPTQGGHATRHAKRCVFFSIKGGVGRSSALTMLAIELASQGKRVLVVDGDFESPGLSSSLLPHGDGQPPYGAVDWLTAQALGADIQTLKDMALKQVVEHSPLNARLALKGQLLVAPAYGQHTQTYVAKLARLYRQSPDGQTYAQRLNRLLTTLETEHGIDVTLFDSRAGIDETSAVAVTQLNPDVSFLFAINTRQTWDAYRLLFQHLQRNRLLFNNQIGSDSDEWSLRESLHVISALTPQEAGAYVGYFENLQSNSYDTFCEIYDEDVYNEEGQINPHVFAPSPDDAEAPHFAAKVMWNDALRAFNPLNEPDLIIESIVQAAFSEFINKANYLLGIER